MQIAYSLGAVAMNASQTLHDPHVDPSDPEAARDAAAVAESTDDIFDPDRKCLQMLPPKKLYKACWASMSRQVLEREKRKIFNTFS